jgi:hypothetical protein
VLHNELVWALVIVPGVPWILAVIGAFIALRATQASLFEDLKTQVQVNRSELRVAGEVHERIR